MKNNNLKKKIISGIMIGSVITSLGVTSFASKLNQEQNKERTSANEDRGLRCTEGRNGQNPMEEQLKTSGIFTDSEIENIKAYLESNRPERNEERQSMKDKTEEERAAYFEAKKEKREEMINGLVTEKIITQAQLDKLKEIMPEPRMRGMNRESKQGNQGNQCKQRTEAKNSDTK